MPFGILTGSTYYTISSTLDKTRFSRTWPPMTKSLVVCYLALAFSWVFRASIAYSSIPQASTATLLALHTAGSVLFAASLDSSHRQSKRIADDFHGIPAAPISWARRATSLAGGTAFFLVCSLLTVGVASIPGSAIVGYHVGTIRRREEAWDLPVRNNSEQ